MYKADHVQRVDCGCETHWWVAMFAVVFWSLVTRTSSTFFLRIPRSTVVSRYTIHR